MDGCVEGSQGAGPKREQAVLIPGDCYEGDQKVVGRQE